MKKLTVISRHCGLTFLCKLGKARAVMGPLTILAYIEQHGYTLQVLTPQIKDQLSAAKKEQQRRIEKDLANDDYRSRFQQAILSGLPPPPEQAALRFQAPSSPDPSTRKAPPSPRETAEAIFSKRGVAFSKAVIEALAEMIADADVAAFDDSEPF